MTLAPFGRRTAEVTAVERLGAYILISARDADGPRDPRPGQFYMLSAAEQWAHACIDQRHAEFTET